MLDKLPSNVLTLRGWGLLLAGVVALCGAQILGRRDLLHLGFFLVLLPLLAALVLHVLKPRFAVGRDFTPVSIEAGSTTAVRLSVRSSGSLGGSVTMAEQLPPRFGRTPTFQYPSRAPGPHGHSLYEYRLHSNRRGLFSIGPVSAEFTDPFGLSHRRHTLGESDLLTVAPAPLELPDTAITGSRGSDGAAASRTQANPSNDDVMTREYRHGDPMRRVHWAATARQGELMVRQEESVTTVQATVILDQRESAYSRAAFTPLPDSYLGPDGTDSAPNFEWAVTAVVSIARHIIDRTYTLRILDHSGKPGLLRSASSPFPDDEEFSGSTGLHNVAEGLAALEVESSASGRSAPAGDAGSRPFGDALMDKLAAQKSRGPLIAITGQLTVEEAAELAPAAELGSHAFALVITEHPQEAHRVLEVLRTAGWHAVAVSSTSSLTAAWSGFDLPQTQAGSTARTTLGATT